MATKPPSRDNRDLYGAGISDFINAVPQKKKLQKAATMVISGD
jgi:hypothetical protein